MLIHPTLSWGTCCRDRHVTACGNLLKAFTLTELLDLWALGNSTVWGRASKLYPGEALHQVERPWALLTNTAPAKRWEQVGHSTVSTPDRLHTNLWSSRHAMLVVLTYHAAAIIPSILLGLALLIEVTEPVWLGWASVIPRLQSKKFVTCQTPAWLLVSKPVLLKQHSWRTKESWMYAACSIIAMSRTAGYTQAFHTYIWCSTATQPLLA